MNNLLIQLKDISLSRNDKSIIRDMSLDINSSTVLNIYGHNGSGKTTTANIIMGHPDFEVTDGGVELNGENLLEMEPWERARAGVFLSFQYPQAVPGLQVGNFLRKSVSSVRGEEAARGSEFREKLTNAMEELDIPKSFLSRYVNDGFSGGEKKRFEILQLMLLQPRLAVLDETDSGLDIDGIRTVSKGINSAVRGTENGALIITHYSRILEHVNPDRVHIMIGGKIVASGGPSLANLLEDNGYDWIEEQVENGVYFE